MVPEVQCLGVGYMINLLEAFSVRYSPLETTVDLIFQALVQPNLLKTRFKFPLSGQLRVYAFILLFFFFSFPSSATCPDC